MNINKTEVDMIIGLLTSVISVVEAIDPNAAQNKVLMQIQSVIQSLQAIGL